MEDLRNGDINVVDISKDPAELFIKFNALYPGKELVIHDSTDPDYLYGQLLSEQGHTFSWNYVESGPEVWVVTIVKQEESGLPTLGQLAAADYRKAQVFENLGLDFCFGGKTTLKQACLENDISEEILRKKLLFACLQPCIANVNYNNWEIDFMADHVESSHHQYVTESISRIQNLHNKLLKTHASSYPNLRGVNEAFQTLATHLRDTMAIEEQILFPLIRFLVQVKKGNVSAAFMPERIEQIIAMLEVEHHAIGQHKKYLKSITEEFTLPPDAPSSVTLLYHWLQLFENDLQQHIHLENNILFPKVIELDKEYRDECRTLKIRSAKISAFTDNRQGLL